MIIFHILIMLISKTGAHRQCHLWLSYISIYRLQSSMKYLCKLILIFDCGHPIYYISLCLLVQCVPLMWNSFHFLFLREIRTHFGDTHYITYKSTNIYTKKYVTFCLTSEHHENDNQKFNDLTFDKDTLLTDLHYFLAEYFWITHIHVLPMNWLNCGKVQGIMQPSTSCVQVSNWSHASLSSYLLKT